MKRYASYSPDGQDRSRPEDRLSCDQSNRADGLPFKDVEKDELVRVIRRFSMVYAVEVLGFCIMGNYFHVLVEVEPGCDPLG